MELPREGGLCRFVALPGVPSEMKPMFRESVLPRLPSGGKVIRRYRVNAFGAGESAVEEKLGGLTARGRDPEVGITAHEATITLRITATGATAAECERQAEAVKAVIRDRLGELVYGEEDEELQHVVVGMLRGRGETLAVVETPLTGGRLTEWLTAVPEVDQVFRGGLTAVSLDIGLPLPGAAVLAGEGNHDAGRRLAEAYRTAFQATWGVAVVGAPAAEGAPGTGTIAVVGSDCVTTVPYRSFGDPAIDRSRAAKTALDLLRRRLLRA
jgi:nicotinamide-nucleotide amidase